MGLLKYIGDKLFSNDKELALQDDIDLIQNDIAALPIIGVNQTWQNMTSSRGMNSLYTNDTTTPIMFTVSLNGGGTTSNNYFFLEIDGIQIYRSGGNNTTNHQRMGIGGYIIPPGSTYSLKNGSGFGNSNIITWAELREAP